MNIKNWAWTRWAELRAWTLLRPRTSTGLGLAFLLLLLWLGSWAGCYRLPLQRVQAFEAIPYNTALVLETPTPLKTISAWREQPTSAPILQIHCFRKWAADLDSLHNLLITTEKYKDLFQRTKLVSGAEWGDQSHFNWLLVFERRHGELSAKNLTTELKTCQVQTRQYRENTIYEISKNGELIFAMAEREGLLLVSRRAHPVESALEQLENIRTNIFFAPNFGAAYKRLTRSEDMNIYVGFRDLPLLLSNLQPTMVQPISELGLSADWAALTAKAAPEQFMFSGTCFANSNSRFWRALSRQIAPNQSNIVELLPDNTAMSLYLGVGDFKSFYADYKPKEHADFEEFVLPFLQGEVLFFVTNPTSSDLATNSFLALRLSDTLQTRRLLDAYGQRYGQLLDDQYQNFQIRRLVASDLLSPVFGGVLHPIQNPYYVLIDDFIVFGNNAAALEVWIEKYNFNKKLINLPEYAYLQNTLARDNQLHLFIQTKYLLPLLQNASAPTSYVFWDEQMQAIAPFHAFTLQLQAQSKNTFTCNMSALLGSSTNNPSPSSPKTANVAWQRDLKDPIQGQPQLIENPHGGYFIATQDTADRLYLFTQDGEQIWEYALDQPIISRIYGLDYNNTKNLQLVFNTRQNIHFIDLSGAETMRIPLPAPATTGLLLIDYQQGVRLLVGCDNGNIYGYKQSGVPLTGWNPKANVGRLTQPLQLVPYKDDYRLVGQFGPRIGIFQFDAIGKSTWINLQAPPQRTFAVDEQIDRLAIGLQNGAIQVANLNGNTFCLAADSRATQNTQFNYANLVGDSRRDYLRYSNGQLILHYYDDQNKYQLAWQTTLSHKPTDVFTLLSPKSLYYRIGGLHRPTGQIFLYDEKGQLLDGFPLPGTSRFLLADFVGDRSESVIVANQASLVVYKLD